MRSTRVKVFLTPTQFSSSLMPEAQKWILSRSMSLYMNVEHWYHWGNLQHWWLRRENWMRIHTAKLTEDFIGGCCDEEAVVYHFDYGFQKRILTTRIFTRLSWFITVRGYFAITGVNTIFIVMLTIDVECIRIIDAGIFIKYYITWDNTICYLESG